MQNNCVNCTYEKSAAANPCQSCNGTTLNNSPPKQTDDGWIEWHGGECPVDGDVLVNIQFRDGDTTYAADKAGRFRWNHAGYDGDIVAYKIHTEQPTSKLPEQPATSALDEQTGGNHYKTLAIQPVEYIHANGIGFFEGSVIKYVSRWRNKNGIEDLKKARHLLDLLIELEEKKNAGN